ncbi:MAG: hypothetical protein GC161_18470 [Planctomycetaceae bacterium]|nr:hypothetical protein [Planctomycetaceae bacterium]
METELERRLRLVTRMGGAYAPKKLEAQAPPAEQRYSGINSSYLVEAGPQIAFKNLFLQAERWRSQSTEPFTGPFDDSVDEFGQPKNPIPVNSKGFPTSLGPATNPAYTQVAMALFGDKTPVGGSYPQGQQWVLKWEGDPAADWGFVGNFLGSDDGLGHKTGTAAGANRRVIDVGTTGGQMRLLLRGLNPALPITKITFCPASDEASVDAQPFRPEFLAHLAGIKCIRFMNWGTTNDSTVSTWAQRRGLDWCFQGWRPGVALEYQAQLINTLGCDGWFCVPHAADDEYVTNLATFLRDNVNPWLRIYIELSNEVWNSTFQGQHNYALTQAQALGLTGGGDQTSRLRWVSHRSVQIFQIFASVFGGSLAARVRRVIGAQNVGAFPAETMLDHVTAGLPAYQVTDLLANAPYVGQPLSNLENWVTVQNWTADQVCEELSAIIASDAFWAPPLAAKAAAAARGVGYCTYEGGQSLGAGSIPDQNNAAMQTLFFAANRSAAMGTVYEEYLAALEARGLGWLNHYSHCGEWAKTFSFPISENMGSQLPKEAAWRAFIAAQVPL